VIQNVHSSYTAHHVHHVHDAYVPHAMIASSSRTSFLCGRHRHNVHNAKLVNVPKMSNASNGSSILYHTFDASYVLHCKSGKAVATHVSPRHKNGKTCVWVPTSYVTNLKGPNSVWVPKNPSLNLFCRFIHLGAQARLSIANAQTT
jgi:hypothetical protein